MAVDHTELEWTYEPTDFFEARYNHAEPDFELTIDGGIAIATLTVPKDPVPSDLEDRMRSFVENIFLVRKFQLRRGYDKLEGPMISQHSPDLTELSLRIGSSFHGHMSDHLDLLVKDTAGNTVGDSMADRIAEHTFLLGFLASKLQQSATLKFLFASYSSSIDDPDNEFYHLYDVREALSGHYGGKHPTLRALGISETDWQRFGFLTNEERLEQSRHRGRHSQRRRPATGEELDELRKLVRQWIIGFARTL